ncbi:MAG: GPW/gp25 family protein [Clostridiales bacterium]|nr:GPW/gp25 family protein [Clostridiales bacterium]
MPLTDNNEKTIGLAFPLRIKEDGGSLMACGYEEHIKQSLRALLLTARGERIMRPEFGSGLGAYLFEGIDATTASLIKREVKNTVERFEPRVELLDVKAQSNAREPGVLRVAVEYRIKASGAADQLTVDISGTRS